MYNAIPNHPRCRTTYLLLAGLALAAILLPGVLHAQAQAEVVTYQVTKDRHKTIAEHERAAFEGALAEAVRIVAGVEVQSLQGWTIQEDGPRRWEQYMQVTRTASYGQVVRIDTLVNGWDPDDPNAYLVKMRAWVELETERPDPNFVLQFDLNDRLFFDRGIPRQNDEIIATVEVSQDAYLTLFQVTEDSVEVIFPNPYMKDNRIPAGGPIEIPSAQKRSMGLHFRAEVPAGRARTFEALVAVVTKQPIAFGFAPDKPDVRSGIVTNLIKAPLLDFNRWLVRIPLSERVIADILYTVERQ